MFIVTGFRKLPKLQMVTVHSLKNVTDPRLTRRPFLIRGPAFRVFRWLPFLKVSLVKLIRLTHGALEFTSTRKNRQFRGPPVNVDN